MVALSEQVAEFTRLLPKIRQDYGSGWAVFLDGQARAAFPTFEEAAKFAVQSFPGQDFLIRHTDEQRETIPFVMIEH